MKSLRIVSSIALCLLLVSCGQPEQSVDPVGTGTYPNSKYVSTETKSLAPAKFGAESSPVHIKIFSDYQCPACITFHEAIEERLWKEYIEPKKLTVSFYNYPLTQSTSSGKPLHGNAEGDALAALCAQSFGKFHDYRNGLYTLENTKSGEAVTDAERIELAQKVGITDPSFPKCLQSAWYQKSLEAEIAEGNRLKLMGTPSIYVNDSIVSFKSADEFFAIVEGLLKQQKTR